MPRVRTLVAVVLIVVALVVQVTVLSRLHLPGATPDLLLVVVVALGIGFGPSFGLGCGFAAGLAADLVPPADHAVGRWALVLGVLGYLAGTAARRLRRSVLVAMVITAAAAAASVVLFAATGALTGNFGLSWGVANRLMASSAVYALVLSPFIVTAVLAVVRRLEPDPHVAP